MPGDDLDATPAVMRNRGVPVVMYAIVRDALPLPDGTPQVAVDAITNILGPPRLMSGDDGEPMTVIEHVRFDMNAIAQIEELWDGLANWQNNLATTKPVSTMRRTLAVTLGRDDDEVGLAMIPQRQGEYAAAIGAAWAIANGVDPTQASQAMRVARAAIAEQVEQQQTELAKTIESLTPPSPGTTGSESGAT